MFSHSKDDVKLEWMYKGPNATVDREEYLMGRAVDKTLEQLNEEEKQKQLGIVHQPKNHVEHECIPPSIRDYKKQQLLAEQVDIQNKLQEDPLIAIKKREEECRRQFLNNPVQLKKLQEALEAQKCFKKDKKKKPKKKHATSDSDSDIDSKLVEKLKLLKKLPTDLSLESKHTSKKKVKAEKDDFLDTILMHKFNAFKSKLSEEDMQDILAGKITDSESESDSDSDRKKSKKKVKKKKKKQRTKHENDSDSAEKDKSKNKYRKKRKKDSSSSSSDSEEIQHKKNIIHKPKEDRPNANYDKSHKDKNTLKSPLRHHYKHFDKNTSNRSKRERESSHGNKNQNKRTEYSSDSDHNAKNKRLRSDNDLKPKMYPENPYNSRKYEPKSSKQDMQSSDSNSDLDSKKRKRNYGLIRGDGKRLQSSNTKKKHPEERKSTSTKSSESKERRSEKPKCKELSREEREKRIKEMMVNAAWRDKERAETVRIHRENESKESKTSNEYNPEFLHKELLKSANAASVESRIKANVNNIQRSSRHMSSNFSKRY